MHPWNVWHTYGSGTVCSAPDVLGLSLVCGKRGVGGESEISMWLARGGVGREGVNV